MLRYQLIKATRRLRVLLGGYRQMEEKHKLFQIWRAGFYLDSDVENLSSKLLSHGYYYNVMSTTYKKQIYTCRKLIDHDHQIHLRFYTDGWVSGHYELRPDAHPLEHLVGVELRHLTGVEMIGIRYILDGATPKT